MENEKEYCEYPNCYNYKIKNSDFCLDHQNIAWYKLQTVYINVGDSTVASMTTNGEKNFLNILSAITPDELRKIVEAINVLESKFNDMNFVDEDKYD